jgi:peptidoglycan/xylan/chitin deacetylase (PgdA/CDA1 family)
MSEVFYPDCLIQRELGRNLVFCYSIICMQIHYLNRLIKRTLFLSFFLATGLIGYSFAQQDCKNEQFIAELYKDSNYVRLKRRVEHVFANASPGHWGAFVKGVDEDLVTQKKIIALTFDACGNKSNKYNAALIDYLRAEHIPATWFVSGKWIDDNLETFLMLSKDTLFEIENHGFNHQPCSVDGESMYGIKGTPDVPDAFDEIEANERKIEKLSGRRPLFYRSATAFTDEACAKIARLLGITIVSFDVLSGDAMPFASPAVIAKNVLQNSKPGAIVIMLA